MYDYSGFYKQLNKNNTTVTDLTQKPGLSSRILAKLGKGEPVSFGTMKSLCDFFGCKMSDLVEYDGRK